MHGTHPKNRWRCMGAVVAMCMLLQPQQGKLEASEGGASNDDGGGLGAVQSS